MQLRPKNFPPMIKQSVKNTVAYCAKSFEGTRLEQEESLRVVKRRKKISHILFIAILALGISLILVLPGPEARYFKVLGRGDLASEDIYSPISLNVYNQEFSENERNALLRRVPLVFDFDSTVYEKWTSRWDKLLDKVARIKTNESDRLETIRRFLISETQRNWSIEGTKGFLIISSFPRSSQLFDNFQELLSEHFIVNHEFSNQNFSTGIYIRSTQSKEQETLLRDFNRVWSLEDAARVLYGAVPKNILVKLSRVQQSHLTSFFNQVVDLNLFYNTELSKKKSAEWLQKAKNQSVRINRGQLLVRRQEKVNGQQSAWLKSIGDALTPKAFIARIVLVFGIAILMLNLLFKVIYFQKSVWSYTFKDSVFFLSVTLIELLIAKHLGLLLKFTSGFKIWAEYSETALPLASGALLLHLMVGRELAVLYMLVMTLSAGFLYESSFFFTIYIFCTIGTGILTIKHCRERNDLYKCGLWMSLVSVFITVCFTVFGTDNIAHLQWNNLLYCMLVASMSGVFSSIITGFLIPVFETLMGYTTSLKLLELSNFNHPLLHDLMMKAPGTYHHSVIVGSLAEVGAESIRANGLLARVGAYYHDIGKMDKPSYFIENQQPGHNPHDHLAPHMSTKILFSHVKNGVKMATYHRLGKLITDIIAEHHGTTLVSYFFHKAKKIYDQNGETLDELEFRYPGPKPNSKESAIVMMADACEAAVRSIEEPNPQNIKDCVSSIMSRRLQDNQFERCDLTLQDMQKIQEAFIRTLVSLHHHRVQYPGQSRI